MKIELPLRENIIKTGNSDSGPERYYSRNLFIRKIYYDRLQKAIDLMDGEYSRLLEVGFGNGMLFPTFNKLAHETFGIDIHGKEEEIAKIFSGNFLYGSIYKIPFENNFFDCIVSLSVIEHLDDMDSALSEISRVAKIDSDIIIGFPTDNFLITLFFWIKKSPALKEHINGPKVIMKKIKEYFIVDKINRLKLFGITFYTAVRCNKK